MLEMGKPGRKERRRRWRRIVDGRVRERGKRSGERILAGNGRKEEEEMEDACRWERERRKGGTC